MTRINIIPPKELTDQHLVAEYSETLMLRANLDRTLKSKKGFIESKVPEKFTLNKGHCYFFYNKGEYIHKRFESLKREMYKRGFTPIHNLSTWPQYLRKNWRPTERDKSIVRKRIVEKISLKPEWYRYYGKPINY